MKKIKNKAREQSDGVTGKSSRILNKRRAEADIWSRIEERACAKVLKQDLLRLKA